MNVELGIESLTKLIEYCETAGDTHLKAYLTVMKNEAISHKNELRPDRMMGQ